MNIIVTGASGFIGSKVSRLLADEFPDFSIIGVGQRKSLTSKPVHPNFSYISCNLLSDNLKSCLPERIDVVIHLAGDRRTFVNHDEFTLQMRANVEMTASLADYAYNAGAKVFVYASTVYVYSGNAAPPFREDSVDIPSENLGATKLASEALLKARAFAGQFRVLSFRIGTVYGPGSSDEQFVPQAIMKLSSSSPVAKFGPADVKRDFVYIDDVARAYLQAVRAIDEVDFAYIALNVGTGRATSVRDVIMILANEIDSEKRIEFDTFQNVGSKADTDHKLDLHRINSVLKWHPEIFIEEGLRRTVKFFLEIPS